MRSMWIIFSKEFLDILRDRRRFMLMLLSTFVFFPLLMFGPFAYMLSREVKQRVEPLTIPVQGLEHAPALIRYLEEEQDIRSVAAAEVEALVADREYPVGLIIPADYETQIAGGRSTKLTIIADRRRAMNATTLRLAAALEEYGMELVQARLRQTGLTEDFLAPLTIEQENAATATETAGSMLGLIIPGVIISLALTSGMPIAVSSIAGEKKKLTLEPVLFTTVSRFQLVFAKLMAVLTGVIVTILSLAGSLTLGGIGFLAVLARSLPTEEIAASAAGTTDPPASSSLLTVGYRLDPPAILLFLLTPLLIILLGAALQILVSTWARNDEEAITYLTPLNLLAGVIVLLPMFLEDHLPRLWHYGLPVVGAILSMRDLLSNRVDPASLAVMFGSSMLYAVLMLALAVWMFQREEIVFRT